MHKRLSLLLLLSFSLAPIAHADDASKATKIQELFNLTHVDHLMTQMADGMLAQMNGMMKQQAAGSDLNPRQQQIMSDFSTKVSGMVKAQLAWEKLKPQVTELYASTYTESEIDAILVFYRSPAGQTMLAKLPELNARSLQIGQTQATSMIPQLRQMSQEFAQQMTEAASKPPVATPSPDAAPSTAKPPASH